MQATANSSAPTTGTALKPLGWSTEMHDADGASLRDVPMWLQEATMAFFRSLPMPIGLDFLAHTPSSLTLRLTWQSPMTSTLTRAVVGATGRAALEASAPSATAEAPSNPAGLGSECVHQNDWQTVDEAGTEGWRVERHKSLAGKPDDFGITDGQYHILLARLIPVDSDDYCERVAYQHARYLNARLTALQAEVEDLRGRKDLDTHISWFEEAKKLAAKVEELRQGRDAAREYLDWCAGHLRDHGCLHLTENPAMNAAIKEAREGMSSLVRGVKAAEAALAQAREALKRIEQRTWIDPGNNRGHLLAYDVRAMTTAALASLPPVKDEQGGEG